MMIRSPEGARRTPVAARQVRLSVAAAVALGQTFATPVLAQQETVLPAAEAVCLSRTVEGAGGPISVSAILPASNADGLIAKGFMPINCDDVFADEAARVAWRDRMCRITAEMPESSQQQLEQYLGERPAVFCGMAELVLGPWNAGELQDQSGQ